VLVKDVMKIVELVLVLVKNNVLLVTKQSIDSYMKINVLILVTKVSMKVLNNVEMICVENVDLVTLHANLVQMVLMKVVRLVIKDFTYSTILANQSVHKECMLMMLPEPVKIVNIHVTHVLLQELMVLVILVSLNMV